MFSRSEATNNRSHILSSPSFSNDSEAAAQQLLAEANSPFERQSAAVLGANLLNAARMLPRSPAMVLPVRNGRLEKRVKLEKSEKPGKLKRISFPQERQKNVRSANVYDVNLSPQKRMSLPAQISAVEIGNQPPVFEKIGDLVPETSQVQPREDQSMETPESEDTPTLGQEQIDERRIEDKSIPPEASPQEDVSSAQHVPLGKLKNKNKAPVVKKRKRLGGWKARNLDTALSEDDMVAPSPMVRQNARPLGKPQPQVRILVRATRSRAARAEAEKDKDISTTAIVAATPGRKKKSSPQSRRTRSSRKAASKPIERKTSRKTAAQKTEMSKPEVAEKITDPVEDDVGDGGGGENNEVKENFEFVECDLEQQAQEEQTGAEDAGLAAAQALINRPGEDLVVETPLERVFNFLNLGERPGDCSTDLGRNIYRTCDRSCIALSQNDDGTSIQDVTQCKDDLVKLLRSTGTTIKESERANFRSDAFKYLFRSLALVLEAMYGRLQEKEGRVTDSWAAMQILFPYINEILIFKDVMDTWKVKIPQPRKGDKLIRGVEGDMIIPLRAVESEFRGRWGQLRVDEHNRQDRIYRQRKRQEADAEKAKREENMKARRKRWQDLHIIRMKCEPEPVRRRRLRFIEPQAIVEKDADGNEFERLSVFGNRNMPPPQSNTGSNEREWTSEQETVFIDALQSSAGLERILKSHCRPGGALRDFTVSELAAKMAWVRSGWTQLSQQHGWEIPEWVTKIPVLP